MSASHSHDEPEPKQEGLKVLSVSDKNPKVRTVQVVRPENEDTTFLSATATGLGITIKHFAKNLFLPRKSEKQLGAGGAPPEVRGKNDIETKF